MELIIILAVFAAIIWKVSKSRISHEQDEINPVALRRWLKDDESAADSYGYHKDNVGPVDISIDITKL